jgi:type IV pilus assembly protein PilW
MKRVVVIARGGRRTQAGHLLLEWMIAAALGLLVLSGALTLYRSQRDTFARSADAATMREAGSAALTIIGQHIQMAGFAPVEAPHLRASVRPGVFGCEGPQRLARVAPDEFVCAPGPSAAAGLDEIMVRYADNGVATWPSAAGQPTDCLGQGVERQGAYAVIVNRFYVTRPRRREEPELACAGNGHAVPQPIVEGIERLTIRYWLPGGDEPVGARDVAPTQWAQVTAVDLCVVVRGRRAGPVTAAKAFVDCEGRLAASPDGRARLSLSRHIALRNREAAL